MKWALGRVASLQVGHGELLELKLMSKLQRSASLEKIAVLKGRL